MQSILKDKKKFAVLFFTILLIDLFVKINLPVWPCRYITKPLPLFLLILYYYFNNSDKVLNPSNYTWVMLGLSLFFIGDFTVLNHSNIYILILSLAIFTIAKIFLCFRLSHKSDFSVSRLIVFSIVIFIYTVCLTAYLYDVLGNFFFPTLISYFTSLLLWQFAFLRKDVVNRRSYLYVFYGVCFFMLSEAIIAIKTFKHDLPFQDIGLTVFYAVGIYLIVNGIVIEKLISNKNPL